MKFIYLSTEKLSPVSAIIRYGTRCQWSHAGFFDNEDRSFLSAQLRGGVQKRYTNPFAGEAKETYSAVQLFSAPGIDEAYQWAMTQIGKPYDWRAILGIAASENWHDGEDYFCSELVASAFEEIGRALLNPSAQLWRITPRDLLLSPFVQAASGVQQ